MSKIQLNDDIKTLVAKMSNGNPGAITAMMEILINGDRIDPNDAMGGEGNLLLLDTFRIYGTAIYVLYNDICDRDVAKMIAILRAAQLGMLDPVTLRSACYRSDFSGRKIIPVDDLCRKVKEELPMFNIIIQ